MRTVGTACRGIAVIRSVAARRRGATAPVVRRGSRREPRPDAVHLPPSADAAAVVLLSARGTDDAETTILQALDDSADWRLEAADGDLLVVHPNGSIRFAGIDPAGIDSFRDVAGAVEIEVLA